LPLRVERTNSNLALSVSGVEGQLTKWPAVVFLVPLATVTLLDEVPVVVPVNEPSLVKRLSPVVKLELLFRPVLFGVGSLAVVPEVEAVDALLSVRPSLRR